MSSEGLGEGISTLGQPMMMLWTSCLYLEAVGVQMGNNRFQLKWLLGFRTSGFWRYFTSCSGWGLHYPRQNWCVIWECLWIWSSYSKSWCQQWLIESWHSYMLCSDCSLTGLCSQSLMLWSISNWTTAMDMAARTEHLEASAGAKYSSKGSCGCFSFSICGICFLYDSGFNSRCRLWPIKPYMLWGWITCGIISPKLYLLVLQHLGREICSRSHQKNVIGLIPEGEPFVSWCPTSGMSFLWGLYLPWLSWLSIRLLKPGFIAKLGPVVYDCILNMLHTVLILFWVLLYIYYLLLCYDVLILFSFHVIHLE